MLILTWIDKKTGETVVARFDVVSNETLESIYAITAHPVEEGSDVTDNAREDTDRITIEGYVSNKPLWSNPGVEKFMEYQSIDLVVPKPPSPLSPTPGGLTRSVTGFVDNLLNPPPSKATVLAPTGDFPDRARLMYETLRKAQQGRAQIKVTAALVELENMMIERLAVPRTEETGNGAAFQLDLRKVRIVKSETVAAPIPIEARGALLSAKGSKAAQKAGDEKKTEKAKSIMAATFDGGAGLLGAVKTGVTGGF